MQKVQIKIPKKQEDITNNSGARTSQIQYDENGDPISTSDAPIDVEAFKAMQAHMDQLTKETMEHQARMIMWATPMALRVRGKKNNGAALYIASLTFLCVDGCDNFFTVTRNFLLDDLLENEALKDLDLHIDNMGTNIKICVDQIINRSKCYVSEFNFRIDDINDKVIYLPCYESATGEEKIFEINADCYMGLKYIEDMIYRCAVEENTFFSFATLIASKGAFSTGFFEIENIDNIVALTSGQRTPRGFFNKLKRLFSKDKGSDNLAVVIKGRRRPPKPLPQYDRNPSFDEETMAQKDREAEEKAQREWEAMEDEEVTLMMTYSTDGVFYKKDKFKGMTIELMENAYYGSEEQYSTTLTNYNCEVGGKNYTALRGKNKEGNIYIFLLSEENMAKLNKMIEEF